MRPDSPRAICAKASDRPFAAVCAPPIRCCTVPPTIWRTSLAPAWAAVGSAAWSTGALRGAPAGPRRRRRWSSDGSGDLTGLLRRRRHADLARGASQVFVVADDHREFGLVDAIAGAIESVQRYAVVESLGQH